MFWDSMSRAPQPLSQGLMASGQSANMESVKSMISTQH